jgi:holo-[acyl-carrier protein] synthase
MNWVNTLLVIDPRVYVPDEGLIMMFFIGCDIEQISRFADKNKDQEFLDLVFSKNEQEYCLSNKNHAQHLAARFCGKEAIIKAFGSAGIEGITYADLEILKSEKGAPDVVVLKKLERPAVVRVSLSHSGDYAMANAIVILNKPY